MSDIYVTRICYMIQFRRKDRDRDDVVHLETMNPEQALEFAEHVRRLATEAKEMRDRYRVRKQERKAARLAAKASESGGEP